jgi:ubiquinone/menaquinone biosynthesis methyltransferases
MNYPQENIKPYGNNGTKVEQVEQMFDNIAPNYDTLNHTLSLGIDRSWRRKAINWLKPYQPQHMLDVATGTGDFAILACRKLNPQLIMGTDISWGMMNVGKDKVEKEGLSEKIKFSREDSSSFSFDDNTFDAITVAFGIRNFEDLDKSLKEMNRVLKEKGQLVILELTTPDKFPMKQLFHIYSKVVIPFMGRLLSKDNSAYKYLPQTIQVFPQGEIMKEIILKAGFNKVKFNRLTFGICTLYTAIK